MHPEPCRTWMARSTIYYFGTRTCREGNADGLATISWQGTVIREVSEEKTENEDLSECGMKWTAVWLKQTHQLFESVMELRLAGFG